MINTPDELSSAVEAITAMRAGNQTKQPRKSHLLDVDHYLEEQEMKKIEAGEIDCHSVYLTDPSPGMTAAQKKQRREAGKAMNQFYINKPGE